MPSLSRTMTPQLLSGRFKPAHPRSVAYAGTYPQTVWTRASGGETFDPPICHQ